MLLETRLYGGFDFLDLADGFFDFAARVGVQQGDACACACGVAGACDLVDGAIGDHAQNHRVFGRNMRAEGPGEGHAVYGVDAELVHQKTRTGIECRLRHLDGADVGVGDCDGWASVGGAIPQEVGVGAPVGDTTGGAGLFSRSDQTRRIQNARDAHFGDDFDDARTANASDAGGGDRLRESVFIRPDLRPDDAEARFLGLGVDLDLFDGTGGGALAGGNLCTLKGWTGWGRAGEDLVCIAQEDLCVGAHVDDQNEIFGLVWGFGQRDRCRVRAHVACDTGQR